MMNINALLKRKPFIFAARNDTSLRTACDSDKIDVIFLLKTDIISAKRSVAYAHDRGKKVFVHIDLMDGLGKDDVAVKYVADYVCPDGIISTKANMIKSAKACGLTTVFRAFLVDSQGMETALHTVSKISSDFVEIMPGVIPSAIKRFSTICENLIAGGMITTKEDALNALKAGAIAVSTSSGEIFD